VRFWFTAVTPTGLHAVRLLTGLLLLLWLLPLAGHQGGLFGLYGWFDRQAWEESTRLLGQPLRPLGWSIFYVAGANTGLLTAIYWASIVAIVLFTLGLWTRLTAALAWVIVLSGTISPAIEYDADAYLILFTFYLMLGYVFLGQRQKGLSLLERLVGSTDTLLLGRGGADGPRPSVAANLALRLIQVHFALVMVVNGLSKLQYGDWWAGYALWYAIFPADQATLQEVRSQVGDLGAFVFVISLAAYAVLAWQLAFPVFAWRHRRPEGAARDADGWLWGALRMVFSARALLLGGGLVSWLGSAFLYRQPLVGPAVFIGCLSYLTPQEWQKVLGLLTHIPGLKQWAPAAAAVGEEPAGAALGGPAPLVAVGKSGRGSGLRS
jgi:hypothetical protein